MSRIAIIGGGMSGMICAICAAASKDNRITIFERAEDVGKKLLMTGNGKCNICNSEVGMLRHYSSSEEALLELLGKKFNYRHLTDFFENMGLKLYARNGYWYPYSNQASSVLGILKMRLRESKVKVVTDRYISHIEKHGSGKFTVGNEEFDYVVLAFGGRAGVYKENAFSGREILRELNIQSSRTFPALTGMLVLQDVRTVAGVRCEAECILTDTNKEIWSERGELQFTDNSLSGIPIFNLSNHIPYEYDNLSVIVRLFPDLNRAEIIRDIERVANHYDNRTALQLLSGMINTKLAGYILMRSGIDENVRFKNIDDKGKMRIFDCLDKLSFDIKGLREYKNAQIMKGGVLLSEVDNNYMLKKHKGVFACGEMLDFNGECGGYNLYFAFESGYTIGSYLAAP